tara:strand:- start:7231 stop:7617 length:387 start_codon:yes stop_codon:yes gene_type:complete
MEYILYFLLFLFGYVTCRTFYFIRSSRISLSLISMAQIIFLSAIKKVESEWRSALHQQELDKNDRIRLEIELEQKIESLRSSAIDYLLLLHPPFYREALQFADWDGAMDYLNKNEKTINEFWRKRSSD